MNALVSFVQHHGDDHLVRVVLGDHQHWTIVSGQGASHDVPSSVIAHEAVVLDRMNRRVGAGRTACGPPSKPVWPMSALRDRFLSAFGPQPPTRTSS